MIKNKKLEELYQTALQRDLSDSIKYFLFLFEQDRNPTDEEFQLIELLVDMYTDVPSVCDNVTELIRSILTYHIINTDEMIEIIKPYHKYLEEKRDQNEPMSFHIRHDLITSELPRELVERRGRYCSLRFFITQASSNITLTNDHQNFCIHSNIFDAIKENNFHGSPDLLDTIVIDLSACETATVGYLCQHWLYGEMKKGRIILPPALKKHVEDVCGE